MAVADNATAVNGKLTKQLDLTVICKGHAVRHCCLLYTSLLYIVIHIPVALRPYKVCLIFHRLCPDLCGYDAVFSIIAGYEL